MGLDILGTYDSARGDSVGAVPVAVGTAAPQRVQKLEPSGKGAPHLEQYIKSSFLF